MKITDLKIGQNLLLTNKISTQEKDEIVIIEDLVISHKNYHIFTSGKKQITFDRFERYVKNGLIKIL